MIVNILGKGNGFEEIKEIVDKPVKERGEIWGVNDAFIRVKCEKAFHMHDLNVWEKREGSESSTKLIVEHLKDNPDLELFTIKPYKKIPDAIIYPLDEIIEYFGSNYFTNGISYMIAYALYKGAKVLNLYGVNLTVEVEYKEQKPNAEYWVGRAQGMGVEVNIQWQHTSLLKAKDGLLYGYWHNQYKVQEDNMPLGWLITYENDGKKGNDFSRVTPFQWLAKYRDKLPNLVLVNWTQEQALEGDFQRYEQLIDIENDFPEVFQQNEPEPQEIIPDKEVLEQNVSRETERVKGVQGIDVGIEDAVIEEVEDVELPDNAEEITKEPAFDVGNAKASEILKELKDNGLEEWEGQKVALRMGKDKLAKIYREVNK